MSVDHFAGRLAAHFKYIIPEDHSTRKIGGSTDFTRDFVDYAHVVAVVHEKYHDWEANARRLVACWNACEGISTEYLESLDAALDVECAAKIIQDRDAAFSLLAEVLVGYEKAFKGLSELGIISDSHKGVMGDRIRAFLHPQPAPEVKS